MNLSRTKIGVLGSGQLGRMFTQSASKLGFQVLAYSPELSSPASKSGAIDINGEYEDFDSLYKFLDQIDVLTFEFENIPESTLVKIEDYIKKRKIVCSPSPNCIKISQDRIKEKSFFKDIGLNTTEFYPIIDRKDIESNLNNYPYPSILKTNRFGYDGKGQWKIQNKEELKKILDSIEKLDHILEKVVDFEMELSIIIARFESGKILSYPPSENIHTDHILDLTIHPARVNDIILKKAKQFGEKLINSLNYVGVLGLEFFMKDGELICNEFAPRPHNSGHFSMDFCPISQFDLQLFTLLNIEPDLIGIQTPEIVMKNIIGEAFFSNPDNFQNIVKNSNYRLHLYQKEEPRPGRKMGHINYNGKFNSDLFPFI